MVFNVQYTDSLPAQFGGYTEAWFIKIRPIYRNDRGLLEHEKVHVRQFWRTCGLHGTLYKFNRQYRMDSEVEAYREQLKWEPASLDKPRYIELLAGFLSTKYDLNITIDEARVKLI